MSKPVPKKSGGFLPVLALLVILLPAVVASAGSDRPGDGPGRRLAGQEPPARVVCLVPAVSEMLLAIGAGEAVVGVTDHDRSLPWSQEKVLVGGFGAPSPDRIGSLAPDLIILASLHDVVRERFLESKVVLLELETDSVASIHRNLALLGKIFALEEPAARVSDQIRQKLAETALRFAPLQEEGLRVIRVMRAGPVWVPGDDSFQNEYIRAAGGIPPRFGRKGQFIELGLEEWRRFDPQVIYGCGERRDELRQALARPGWREVEAVREDRIYFFPCDLTCRASVRAGDFVVRLANRLAEIQAGQAGGARNRAAKPQSLGSAREADELPH